MQSTAEMIFTGDELLRGDIVNTNQSYLGEKLLDLGIFATHALCVTDDRAAITKAIGDSLGRQPAVLILSGGLGPTEDDLTREATADAFGLGLVDHPELLEAIRTLFKDRGFVWSENNRKQATLPDGAIAIPMRGTAPGFYLEAGGTLVVALPGVPRELKEMWTGDVEPLLRERRLGTEGFAVRRVRTFGLGESRAADMLSGLEWRGAGMDIGTRASKDGLTIILRAVATPQGVLLLEQTEARIREILGDRVYGVDDDDLAAATGELLRRAGLTVSSGESCTGGLVAKRFTDAPGSSDYFVGGVVTYSNGAKSKLLGVDEALLAAKGAVSSEVAAAMAEGARSLFGTGCAVSTTGVAGPGGGSAQKPVGLVFIGSVVAGVTVVEELHLPGTREEIRYRSAQAAIDLLRRRLLRPSQNPAARLPLSA